MLRENLSFGGLLLRLVAALVLVYGTWNPEGMSFYDWALAPLITGQPTPGPAALKFLVGVVLVTLWVIFLNATRRSLGVPGALLAFAITGGVIWLLIEWDVMHASSGRGIAHTVLIALAIMLCAGMSWSFVSRRLSGQVDTDVVD